MMKKPVFLRNGILWIAAAVLLLATAGPPLQAQNYTPLESLRVSDGRVQFLFASAGQCINLSNSRINGVAYTTHTSKWQRRAGSSWVDIPGTERAGLCSYSPTNPGEYRLVAEISIDGERGIKVSFAINRREWEAETGRLPGVWAHRIEYYLSIDEQPSSVWNLFEHCFTYSKVFDHLAALLHDSTAARVGALFQLLVQDTTAQDFGLPSSAIRLRM